MADVLARNLGAKMAGGGRSGTTYTGEGYIEVDNTNKTISTTLHAGENITIDEDGAINATGGGGGSRIVLGGNRNANGVVYIHGSGMTAAQFDEIMANPNADIVVDYNGDDWPNGHVAVSSVSINKSAPSISMDINEMQGGKLYCIRQVAHKVNGEASIGDTYIWSVNLTQES